jgi:DNA-binding CsgD family transcriptional regulator
VTVQEAQVARLARDGLSNPEIGARNQLHKVLPGDLDTVSSR